MSSQVALGGADARGRRGVAHRRAAALFARQRIIVTAYIVMAYVAMAAAPFARRRITVMAYIVMAYVVMAAAPFARRRMVTYM